jgi:signal transduction histidine kinase
MRMLQQIGGEMMALAASNGQILIVELPPFLPPIWGEEDRLRQVVLNLLINATKFTPEGGKITLRAKDSGQNIVFQVQDTGRGIPVEDQNFLFQAYHWQANDVENLSGLGLGLSLCKLLVELHGGKIWAESTPGQGSTFSFSIPIRPTEQEQAQISGNEETS